MVPHVVDVTIRDGVTAGLDDRVEGNVDDRVPACARANTLAKGMGKPR
jgi:hypothetical protein